MRVAILLFDGFDEFDALGPFEVFRTASDMGADLDARLVTVEPADEVTAAHGLRVRPDGALRGGADLVLVPGGGWLTRSERGAWGEARRGVLPSALARLHAEGTVVATVCTGAMLASAAGVLSGRPAATHHAAAAELRQAGAWLVEARVVDDGDLLTAGGVTAGLDLALWIVERRFGADLASAVARELEYEPRGVVWHPRADEGRAAAATPSPARS